MEFTEITLLHILTVSVSAHLRLYGGNRLQSEQKLSNTSSIPIISFFNLKCYACHVLCTYYVMLCVVCLQVEWKLSTAIDVAFYNSLKRRKHQRSSCVMAHSHRVA